MKRLLTGLALSLSIAFVMTSCYTYTFDMGDGPQTGIEETKKNHYFIFGLVAGETSDPTVMAGDADDYRVTVQHTFVDGLISAITFGIYNPTTTKVTK